MYQSSIRGKKKHQKFHQNKFDNYSIDPENEEYAYVQKMLGNYNVRIVTNTGIDAIGIIRGSMRKFNTRILIEAGDIVVVSKRDYQVNKVDIVHKYNADQVQSLISDEKLSNILLHMYNYVKKSDVEGKDDVSNDDTYIDFGHISSDSE